ncbi:MucBP domain-containing protein [Enterococcus gallinarum]|uniref:LPXTG cell wall anchor domain-containing protein n=1 Tax=Enterococcus gallinarum TaxID=1353 RepID=A0AAE7MRW5_ENTGA|nr:MucBP domain-containing protein [Enterococcus gallinarum]MBM6741878.1 MucBP domain-containing protein [Enterococcus gallinarum]MDT2679777.1 MucBP domain-containing protein [Enterococcus gallinarum]QOG28435.1 LPXTG cell wall anchor domain-containing protein [Enterococcus gallinarum]ROY69771.1 LPXTG cell wall anchor domain-containing protein [Enterococcus gallinarum]ROZ08016.1 LPXTG cell wall anchor domain-containing protein [Enterococcus gallinarum]
MKQRIKIYLSVIILLSAALGIPAFTVYAESQTMAVLEDAQETQETSVESQTKEKMLAVTSSTTSSTDDLPSSSPVSEQTDNSQKRSEETEQNTDERETQVSTDENSQSSAEIESRAAKVAEAQLKIHVSDSNVNQGISGAYFTFTSVHSGAEYLLVTDINGDISVNVPAGAYMLKQVGTTDQKENYAFTSTGNSIELQPGEVKFLSLYERHITGEYAFGNSPDTIHLPVGGTFDFTTQALGIEAFKLNFSGAIEKSISASQIYPYYSNVDTSVPGSYVAIFMARQATYSVNTTHVVHVIVDPASVGEVTVKYVDTDGNEIHQEQSLTGAVGETYDTTTTDYQLAIDGYTLDTTQLPDNMTGTFSDTAQTVTYVYTKDPIHAADVTVEYVDKEGNQIHESQTLKGNIGDKYDANTPDYQLAIDGYTLDTTQLPDNMTGTFSDTAQTVTYIYTKDPIRAADVTVEYVDNEGKEIHESQTLKGNIGEKYDASTPTYQLAIDGYTLDSTQLPDNMTGKFSDKAQTVTYVYIKDPVPAADVMVEYVDNEGNQIHEPQTLSGNIGEKYDVSTPTYQLTIDGYTLDTNQLPDNMTGVFSDTAQTVTYVYTKDPILAADVMVEYVDNEGKEIHEPQTLSGNIGEKYDVSTATYQLMIDGYTLNQSQLPKNMTGTFSDKAQTVTYVYTKDPMLAADVTIEYVDSEGNQLHESQILKGTIGEEYDVSTPTYQLTIDGYTLDATQLPDNITGVFSDTAQTVTYVYTKDPVPAADVTIKYVDSEGKEIHESQAISGKIGEKYDASTPDYQLTIDGYTLDTMQLPDNMTGTFSDTAQTVTYVYTKDPVPAADVTINYVDNEGKEIHESQTLKGNIGEKYDASTPTYQLTIDGYTLDATQLPDNITGVFSDTAQTVTYVYTKDPVPAADVTIKYVDNEGKEIHKSKTLTGNIGEKYDASTPDYQLTIDGYTLDTTQLPDKMTGTFSDTAQTVTYIYTKDPILAADVTVKYVDNEGNQIHESQTLKGNIGDKYDASTPDYQLPIDGYTLDTNQLPDNMTGTFNETEQTVTYVYTKNTLQIIDNSKQVTSNTKTENNNIKTNLKVTTARTAKTTSTAQRTLPQTNEKSNGYLFLGLGLTSFVGWGLWRRK